MAVIIQGGELGKLSSSYKASVRFSKSGSGPIKTDRTYPVPAGTLQQKSTTEKALNCKRKTG